MGAAKTTDSYILSTTTSRGARENVCLILPKTASRGARDIFVSYYLKCFLIRSKTASRGAIKVFLILSESTSRGAREQISYSTYNDVARSARKCLSHTTENDLWTRARSDFEIHRKLCVKITTALRLFYFMRTLTP